MGKVTASWYHNRLTVTGPAAEVRRFEKSKWEKQLAARYTEPLLRLKTRARWQFETDHPPAALLKTLSRRWPQLTCLLDYDEEGKRVQGLLWACNGKLAHCEFNY